METSQRLIEIKSIVENSYRAGYAQAIEDLKSEIINNMHVDISAKMLNELLNDMKLQKVTVKTDCNKSFGEKTLNILKYKGISQRELSEKVGCTEVSISRYISGERVPKGTIVVKIANALGVSTDYLLDKKYESEER